MAKDLRLVALVLVLLVIAVLSRSLSQQWSPLPYNVDGLSEVRVADAISTTGHFTFQGSASYAQGYVSDMPVLGLVISFVTSSLGLQAVDSAQLITALLGSVAVLLVLAIFERYWRSSTRASFSTVLVLALIGSFVFSAGCTWKETLGFLLMMLALYSFHLRSKLPYGFVLVSSLALLPFTHHQATVVGFIIITFAILIEYASKPRHLWPKDMWFYDGLLLVSIWFIAIFYYIRIRLPYLDYLSPKTDLYLYLAVALLLFVVCVRLSRKNQSLSRLPLSLAVPAVGALFMAYNFVHPVFIGTSAPALAAMVPFMAYLILVVPAWTGVQLAFARMGEAKNLVLAMFFGPLSLIMFAFLRGLDTTSYTVIYRTFDFLMPAFAVFIGLGFAALVKGKERLGMLAGVSLVVVLASTLPVAYSSQQLFGVENQTYWYEYDAFQWMSGHGIAKVTSDQRLSDTGWRLFDIGAAQGLPFDLKEGISLQKGQFYVLEDQWSTDGAQQFPLGVVVVSHQTVASTLQSSDVVYVGGSPGGQLTGFYAN